MVKVGDQIELIETTSINLMPGDKGKVVKIEIAPGTKQYILWADWGDKGTVPLMEGEDKFKVLSQQKVN
jgi:hypothetical protein